jgi:hypothetical protein
MAPAHGFVPRLLMIGSMLVKKMVPTFEINKSVGVVNPSLFGLVMISESGSIVHLRTSLIDTVMILIESGGCQGITMGSTISGRYGAKNAAE